MEPRHRAAGPGALTTCAINIFISSEMFAAPNLLIRLIEAVALLKNFGTGTTIPQWGLTGC